MMSKDEVLRKPASVEEMDSRGIKGSAVSFIKGALYQFISDQAEKTDGEISFCIRDLLGGANADWENTPLQYLYDYHIRKGKTEEEAYAQTARDAGWLLKEVLCNDPRYTYEPSNSTWSARSYTVRK